eukprot:m.110979 g.110979  ORF g.110979 m.110979 type:complete len:196 (+) comp9355_c0_seq3:3149-3736(+)
MAALTGRPVLGLDIGTTSVKACLLDASGGVLAAVAQQHDAYRAQREFTKAASSTLPEHDHRRAEQSPRAIADALAVAIAGLPAELRAQVRAVGITGQMHGVLLWQAADPQSTGSPLVTWEDKRCSPEFLAALAENGNSASGACAPVRGEGAAISCPTSSGPTAHVCVVLLRDADRHRLWLRYAGMVGCRGATDTC